MKFISFVVALAVTANLYANCEENLFSFKVKSNSGTVLDVLENLTQECKMSIVFTDKKAEEIVNKKVSYMNVHDVPLSGLLTILLKDNNLFYTITPNNVIKISYLKTATFNIDYVNFSTASNESQKTIKTGSSGGAGGTGGSGSTKLDFKTEFRFWDNLQKELDDILSRDGESSAKTTLNKEAGVVTVTGTQSQIERVGKYIKKITNRLHKQVVIDAKIIEVTYKNSNQTGIDWKAFQAKLSSQGRALDQKGVEHTLSNPLSFIKYNYTLDGLLNFLKTQGDVSIVSNPKIMALNNQPAIINVGEEKNYKYTKGSTTTTTNGVVQSEPQYEVGSTFVGVTLGIVPEVTEKNDIILKINPTVSEISDIHIDKDGNPNLAPDIKIKQLSSIIKVHNGERVIIGGLVQKRVENRRTKVPVLGSIPVFGKVFQSDAKVKSKSELIIVMTPKLVGHNDSELVNLEGVPAY